MTDRKLERKSYDKNPLLQWPNHAGKLSTAFNTAVLHISKFLPLGLKNKVLRATGLKIGKNTAIGLGVQFDVFFPGKISIGSSTTIGYGTTILAHGTTREDFREGNVEIGDNVLIGANTTVLPGVTIGDNAKISANSLVNRDVEAESFVGGTPVEKIGEE